MVIFKYKNDFDDVYILHLKKNFSKRKFIQRMRVTSLKFAGKLLGRIYDSLLSEIIDLKLEYETYHSKEYDSFGDFLKNKYSLPDKVISEGLKLLHSNGNSSLFFRREHASGDYNMDMFIMSEDGCRGLLENILGGGSK